MPTFKSFNAGNDVNKIEVYFVLTVEKKLFFALPKLPNNIKSVTHLCTYLHNICSLYPGSSTSVRNNLVKHIRYIPDVRGILYIGAFIAPRASSKFQEFLPVTGTKYELMQRSVTKLCEQIDFRFYTFSSTRRGCLYANVSHLIVYSKTGHMFDVKEPGSTQSSGSACELGKTNHCVWS